jgi:hypothetical protein
MQNVPGWNVSGCVLADTGVIGRAGFGILFFAFFFDGDKHLNILAAVCGLPLVSEIDFSRNWGTIPDPLIRNKGSLFDFADASRKSVVQEGVAYLWFWHCRLRRRNSSWVDCVNIACECGVGTHGQH